LCSLNVDLYEIKALASRPQAIEWYHGYFDSIGACCQERLPPGGRSLDTTRRAHGSNPSRLSSSSTNSMVYPVYKHTVRRSQGEGGPRRLQKRLSNELLCPALLV
jgi:hypothetical protein